MNRKDSPDQTETQKKPWHVTVLTLFPEVFPGVLGASLPGKALKDGLWTLKTLDIRAFACDKHATVDDTPYGGGAGMVMRPDVIAATLRAATPSSTQKVRKLYLSPRGQIFNQNLAKELANAENVVILCGRYEGVDQRVIDAEELEEVSLGDFILAGGEVAAMMMIEAVVRLLPNVLGNAATTEEESFEQGLLEYPHYTRPAVWEGREVPDVLVSGHHEKVRIWRQQQAETLTEMRRPDLWAMYRAQRPAPSVHDKRARKVKEKNDELVTKD